MTDTAWVLGTGSRLIKLSRPVLEAMDDIYGRLHRPGVLVVVIHGDNKRGADMLMRAWAANRKNQGWAVDHDPHPADWPAPCVREPPAVWNGPGDGACHHGPRRYRREAGPLAGLLAQDNGITHCPFAGPRRNQAMVDKAAARRDAGDVVECVAFLLDGAQNDGTRDCRDRMEHAGLACQSVTVIVR